jgi:hypothetical protein
MMDQPPNKTWWGRNWFWVVPLGCLSPFLFIGGCAALLAYFVFSTVQASEPYLHALAAAGANQEVKAQLGEPIRAGYLTNGRINVDGDSGKADFAIPVSGPKSSGTIYVVATRAAGKWEYSTLEFAPDGAGNRIDLRSQPAKEQAPAEAAHPNKARPQPSAK